MIHTVRHREQVLADMKRFLQDEAGESLETEVAMENEIETELAFQIADRYITIQEVTDGYDHTIYDMNFKELDGGVYDNPDIGIREALAEIVEDLKQDNNHSLLRGNIQPEDELIPMDYEEITEKAEVANRIERKVTLYVAECGEFHNLGAFYEGITSVDQAIEIYNQIPPERLHGIRAIGVNVYTPGEDYQDTEWDIMTGGSFSIDMLDYIPEIKDCPQAMDKIAELIAKKPDKRTEGTLAPEVEAKMWEYREQYVESVTKQLAVDIDQFSYDYNTYGYHDSITDREGWNCLIRKYFMEK